MNQSQQNIVNPITGELWTLRDTTETLARHLYDAKQLQTQLKEYTRAITDELLSRMDKRAFWTIEADNLKLNSDSPDKKTYNVEQLQTSLKTLVDAGTISEDAYLACFKQGEVTVSVNGINRLKKLGDETLKLIEKAAVPVIKSRSINIEELPPRK